MNASPPSRTPPRPRATTRPAQRPVVVPRAPPAPAPDAPPPPRESLVAALVAGLALVAFLVIVHVAVSLTAGEPWYGRLWFTIVYGVPCGLAMVLLGYVSWRMPGWARLVSALVIGATVGVALVVGGSLRLLVLGLFLFCLPLWSVLAVTGTARFRWSALQVIGATLVLEAVWIPLYGSFPALTQLATASGTLQPYSVTEMYVIVSHKLLHETFMIASGLLLLTRRFPFIQKSPDPGDWRSMLRRIGTTSPYNGWVTAGLGASTFVVAFFGTLFLQGLFEGTSVAESGTDDTRVFERITPELVLLLSFAAGAGEELIFRGVLQPVLERVLRRTMPLLPAALCALLLQALLFGVVHAGYGNLLHVLLPFAFGLLTGAAYRLYGLAPAFYAHFMIDVFAFGYDASQRVDWVGLALYVLLGLNLLAGIAGPLWLLVTWVERRFDIERFFRPGPRQPRVPPPKP